MIEPRLPRISSESDFWLDESIWGHRLREEQTPWLSMLEFLVIVQSQLTKGIAFIEKTPNTLQYSAERRLYLRNILFNNPFMPALVTQEQHDDARWKAWFEKMTESQGGLTNPDFSYLRQRFGSFSDFAEIVKFFQSSAFEGDSNKRWTSKFVFPYGPDCLFEDLRISGSDGGSDKVGADRRFFARTGELLYLMLCRSGKGDQILTFLTELGVVGTPGLASPSAKWNRLAKLLQPEDSNQGKGGSPPYLPFQSLPEYTALAEDWLNIRDCKMPGYDSLPHLVTLTGLHMVMYFLKRSTEILGMNDPTFVLEIVAPRKTIVRELSSDSYLDNNGLSEKALVSWINAVSEDQGYLTSLEDSDALTATKEFLRNRFAWSNTVESEFAHVTNPSNLLENFSEKAVARHKQHVKKFHHAWCRQIGLSSRRGSARLRYAPTDALLKTLVLANVPKRLEFKEFLERLYVNYGFVIGDKQASTFIDKGIADQDAFSKNALRLEERLARLGLLRRLSDACAYVQNPFFVEQLDAVN